MESQNASELAMFQSFLRGEESGFSAFFRAYFPVLCLYACTWIHDRELAEDLVQNCFIRLWEKRARVKRAGALRSYLYTMVRHECLNHLRHAKYADGEKEAYGEVHPIIEESAVHRVIAAETMREIQAAIRQLPPAVRRTIDLLLVEEKKVREVAVQLGLSEQTIRNQKAQGLSLLRRLLGSSLAFLLAWAG